MNGITRNVAHAALIALLTTGCALGGTSPPVHFCTIEPLAERSGAASDASVGVGPVLVPRYLDRAGLVTRKDDAEIEVASYARWAEPLDDMIASAIAENLVRLTGSHRIFAYPWPNEQRVDHRVFVRIVQFEIGADGAAHLVCQWQIESKGAAQPRVERTELTVQPAGSSAGKQAVALSETIAKLSREIATAVGETSR
jgi:uncharacterized lipoprotein YmbA